MRSFLLYVFGLLIFAVTSTASRKPSFLEAKTQSFRNLDEDTSSSDPDILDAVPLIPVEGFDSPVEDGFSQEAAHFVGFEGLYETTEAATPSLINTSEPAGLLDDEDGFSETSKLLDDQVETDQFLVANAGCQNVLTCQTYNLPGLGARQLCKTQIVCSLSTSGLEDVIEDSEGFE